MADLKFDEKMAEFRKTISANKAAWQSILEKNEQKLQKQLEEKDKQISEIKTKYVQMEVDLNADIQRKQKILDVTKDEIKNFNADISVLIRKVSEEERTMKEEEKSREEEIKNIQREIEQVGVDAGKRNHEHEEEWELVDAKEKNLVDQSKVLLSRLGEEQIHWEELLKMKEQDFIAIKNELEQRLKEWQSEYHKKEEEVLSFRKNREKLEIHLTELDEISSSQEIKVREQILIKQDEINTLKRDLATMEAANMEEIKDKELAVEALKQEIEKFLGVVPNN
ncbi:MAG: hypothetical protein PHE88_08800 [Elusimicrobia bacterium]|nr:hypothetical protein [Elusimicrobiota bacterium]